MLLITHTTLSVPSLTGAIMCMGVATANSILMVSFAREQMDEGKNPLDAAVEAGFVRMRPVIMTALAMIIGMVPMAIGLGNRWIAVCHFRDIIFRALRFFGDSRLAGKKKSAWKRGGYGIK
jgi:multidrug efflux pump subunit AcrB